MMNAWWLCPNGHEYQATVKRARRATGAVNLLRRLVDWFIRAFVRRSPGTCTRSIQTSYSRWPCRLES